MTQPQDLASVCRLSHAVAVAKWLCALSILVSSSLAHAQTWAGKRQRPSLREIATVDRTGEATWLWGPEDVAGNGLGQFPDAEQAMDARSVYLRFDGERLWWRTYFSATAAPDNNLTAYLFIDSDFDANSGRSAAAPEIDPAFVADPSAGGYEFVLSVRGDGGQPRLWQLDSLGTAFVESSAIGPNPIDSESSTFLDPLRIGASTHGYVQASIASGLVAVWDRCQAHFYVRTTNRTPALGPGDLDVGEAMPCEPVDGNANRVPDVVEPVAECQTNDQCPSGGVCWNGRCWLAPVCADDTDCPDNATCVNGSCVTVVGNGCSRSSDCLSGLCRNGRCVACKSNGDCGAGRVCGPDGRCVDEDSAGPDAAGGTTGRNGPHDASGGAIVLESGERIQGGACACRFRSNGYDGRRAAWWVLAAGIGMLRRRRSGLGLTR